MLYLEPFGATDAGKVRANNEDALLVGEGKDETLFAVADGIGGFEAGEVASRIAVDVLKELEPGDSFEVAIREANRRILAVGRGDERLSGMGTTLVAVRFGGTREEPMAQVAHVGDSRAYLLRGEMQPLTEDHSLVAELVRSGDLTRDQAADHPQKNLITRALGADEEVEVDTMVLPVEAGDRLLLCSDGLSDMVPETRIGEILADSPGDPETPARNLVSAALDAGGSDNVTVVVVDVKQETSREEHSGDTREMPAVSRSGDQGGSQATSRPSTQRPPRGERRGEATGGVSRRRPNVAREKRKRGGFGRFVRGLAAVLIVVVALTPAYLWGSSRYFLGLDEGEVVAYQGLPYEPLGVKLNQEWRRTGVQASEVKTPYRGPIENHTLYTQAEIEPLLQDLGK
jgi:serine/threonine protein phosphatase PrpC